MHWIALLPPEHQRSAWAWRALRFTPRVAWADEALILEISACERLWGGPERLLRRFLGSKPAEVRVKWASAATSLIAIALLRLRAQAQDAPLRAPDGLPLSVLGAARPHLATLERTGCTTWGQVRALPRAGVARRFGADLLGALDAAFGEQPETYPWLSLPEVFDEKLELPALATTAPELMWAAQRLLGSLQAWLRARQQGVLALELEWTLDLKRHNGRALPPHQQLPVRTAQPTQGMAHLRRLVGEQLARVALAAPASHLRLRSLETTPWAGASTSLLAQDLRKGDRLHELVERLSARLGADQVLVPVAHADHRPEHMQRWVPARGVAASASGVAGGVVPSDVLYPSWLLRKPLPLQVRNHVPHYHGPLQRLSSAQRIEAGWWGGEPTALRDYFLARSERAGLLWIYRERPTPGQDAVRWFLHGVFA